MVAIRVPKQQPPACKKSQPSAGDLLRHSPSPRHLLFALSDYPMDVFPLFYWNFFEENTYVFCFRVGGGFILDALGLYRDKLLRTLDEHKRNPDKWWLDLAENDDAREKLFHVLSEERVLWSAHARIAIGRALEDIRRSDPERSMLLPSKKKRVMVEGTSINKEDVMIQKTENVEDEVEVFEEA